jgi:hypothetical protein
MLYRGEAVKLNPGVLPKDLVLDLIAITRLLYAKEHAADGRPVKLQEIADVGRSLKMALDMATKCEAGTIGMRAAWDRADNAVEALSALLAEERALPLLHTVQARLLKIRRRNY